jgi:hypothetical protein
MAAVVHQEVRVTGPLPLGLPHDLWEFRVRGKKARYAVQAVAAGTAASIRFRVRAPTYSVNNYLTFI